jgi:hypothetical protein
MTSTSHAVVVTVLVAAPVLIAVAVVSAPSNGCS